MKFLSNILVKAGLVVEGSTQLNSLAGVGTRMVVTNAAGVVSTQAIPVTSVFGRTGAVLAQAGDYTTAQVTESGNLYYTDARARAAISVAGSGSYNPSTGVITINGGVTSVNGLTGAVTLTTSNIGEGTNLYYTDARSRAAISVVGSGSYNATTGVITINGGVTSVNGLTGAVTLTTTNISEGTNLYYTDARARAAISLTTTGSSGAATYSAGVLNVPNYTLAGLGGISGSGASGQVTYWTGASAVSGSNNLFWDNSLQRLSITGTNASDNTTLRVSYLNATFSINNVSGTYANASLSSTNLGGSVSYGLTNNSSFTGSVILYNSNESNNLFGSLRNNSFAFLNISATKFYIGNFNASDLIFGTTNLERMRLFAGGNFSIGTSSDLGTRLGVVGDTLLRGSGNTSATTALTVQNSDSTAMMQILNNGYLRLGSGANSAVRIYPTDTSGDVELSGLSLVFNSRIGSQTTAAGIGMVMINGFSGTSTSGAQVVFLVSKGFAPTSGTGTYVNTQISPVINQTGGANGITIGLHVNPILTAAADWRSIEWSNNSGWGLYGSGTANNYLGGSLGVGVSPSYRLQIAPSATYTAINTGDGLSIYNPTLSGANLFLGVNGIGTSQGALIQGRSGLTSTYQIQLQPYGGNVGIGINPSHRLDVDGNIGISGTIYAGKSGDFNLLYDWQGNIGIWVGNNTSAYNQYSNNSHFFTNKSGATSYATFDSTGARIYGKVVAGTDSSTNGSIILQDSYSSGNLTNIGTSFSSGAPVIGFGVTPSTSAIDAFVSSTTLTAYPRGAFVVSDSLKYFSTTSATAAVGSAVTLTKRLELFNTGNLVIGGGADNGTNRLQVGGSISATSDSVINGVTIGKGGGGGALNTAVGSLALSANTTGASNTAFGLGALAAITTGSDNVAVGTNAGRYRNGTTDNIDSSGGVYIGNASRASATATTNEIVIGAGAQGAGSNTVTIGNTGIISTTLRGNVTTNGSITSSITQTATASSVSISLLGSNITSYAAGFSMVNLGYGLNAMYAQHEQRFGGNATFAHGNINGAGLLVNKLAPTAAGTVTITQQAGQLRTMSNLHLMTQFDGNNNLTVTDMSGLHIYGHYRTSGTGTLTVSNAYYGIFLADPNEFGTGATITGSNYGFYQQGTAPFNHFGGKVIIGTTATDGTSKLRISGLPTSSAGLLTGEVWNNGGVLTIV